MAAGWGWVRVGACSALAIACAAPPWAADGQDVDAVRADVAEALEGYRSRSARWGVLVVSLDTGDTLFALDPDSALAPASNIKLLTTAAALLTLGPEYRFRTYLLGTGDVSDGVLHGDLVLYGTGDPGLSDRFHATKTTAFHHLAEQLREAGVHTVTGDLVADASYLPGPLRPESWDPRDLNDHFAPGISALSFNENVVSFRVEPGRWPGAPPTVHTIPEHTGLEIVNLATTTAEPPRWRVSILRDDPMEPVRVEGQIQRGSRDVWRQLTVSSPAHFTAAAFGAVLEERGVRVLGGVRVSDDPAATALRRVSAPAVPGRRGPRVLARHTSAPLREYLAVINKQSDNLFAELVFRLVGRTSGGLGSPEASAHAVRRTLEDAGVAMAGTVQLDGSGLSGGNRVSPATFVSVMERMAGGAHWAEYWASLPEAGRRRELGRMYDTPAAGNLRAKTGTIEGVSALSGLVRSRDGERFAFSIMVNGAPSTTRAKRVENYVGARLASFTRDTGTSRTFTAVAPPAPTQTTELDDGRHRVRPGENLTGIARRYGLTVDELLRANPAVVPNRIYSGQWLNVPARGGE